MKTKFGCSRHRVSPKLLLAAVFAAHVGLVDAHAHKPRFRQSATPTSVPKDADSAPESAVTYLQGRLAGEREQATLLRGQLREAIAWGRALQRELADETRDAASEERTLRHVMTQQENRSATAVVEAQHREQQLQVRLSLAAAEEKKQTSVVATLRRQIEKVDRTLRAEARERHVQEVAFKRKLAEEAAKAQVIEEELRQAKAAKATEDAELRAAEDRAQQVDIAHDEAKKAEAREHDVQERLSKEERDSAAMERALTAKLSNQERRARGLQAKDEKLRQKLANIEAASKAALANATARIELERSKGAALLKAEATLDAQLKGNASKVSILNAEVAELRKNLDESGRARKEAEAVARKTQEALDSAQAVARQLSGAVPQLLEQARLAHEAQDAEKAMRTESQAKARQQISRLEDQYIETVRQQLAQVNTPSPPAPTHDIGQSGGSDADAGAADLPLVADDEGSSGNTDGAVVLGGASVDADGQEAEAQAATAIAGFAELAGKAAEAPDLAQDSNGLGKLLRGADGGGGNA